MPCKYPLVEVKKFTKMALENPESEKVWFSAPSRSTHEVVKTLRSIGMKVTSEKANEYIMNSIMQLTDSDFYRQEAGQWGFKELITDQYGIRKDGIAWFIKFIIENGSDCLDEISFHETNSDMRLENGTTIKKARVKI